jgi:hypothetical protein
LRGGAEGATLALVRPPFLSDLQEAFEGASGRPLAQAATVSPAGMPEVRTVVLRHLAPDGSATFASDARSTKMAALAEGGWLELCLWRPEAGLQLRLLGRARLHRLDDHAVAVWAALPLDTRALFSSPAPGTPLRGAPVLEAPAPGLGDRPPTPFAAVRVTPERCDRLELGPPLRRRIWTLGEGGWRSQDVVP